MPNNQQPKKTVSGTDIQKVKQQNAGTSGMEFASETDVQRVKQQNAQSQAKKSQQSQQ